MSTISVPPTAPELAVAVAEASPPLHAIASAWALPPKKPSPAPSTPAPASPPAAIDRAMERRCQPLATSWAVD